MKQLEREAPFEVAWREGGWRADASRLRRKTWQGEDLRPCRFDRTGPTLWRGFFAQFLSTGSGSGAVRWLAQLLRRRTSRGSLVEGRSGLYRACRRTSRSKRAISPRGRHVAPPGHDRSRVGPPAGDHVALSVDPDGWDWPPCSEAQGAAVQVSRRLIGERATGGLPPERRPRNPASRSQNLLAQQRTPERLREIGGCHLGNRPR
ncbi:MAG: hypothetical protein RL033_5223 [Pseudomonadota bacterium]